MADIVVDLRDKLAGMPELIYRECGPVMHHAADEIERLRELAYAPDGSEMRSALFKEAEWRGQLYDALQRINSLNDHPGHYNPDIQRVLDAALTGHETGGRNG